MSSTASFSAAIIGTPTPSRVSVTKSTSSPPNAVTALAELAAAKMNFNVAISQAIVIGAPGNNDFTLIESYFDNVVVFLNEFITCLNKINCVDPNLYCALITIIKAYFPLFDVVVTSGTKTCCDGASGGAVTTASSAIMQIDNFQRVWAQQTFDLLLAVLTLIDNIPDRASRCQLIECLFKNIRLVFLVIYINFAYYLTAHPDVAAAIAQVVTLFSQIPAQLRVVDLNCRCAVLEDIFFLIQTILLGLVSCPPTQGNKFGLAPGPVPVPDLILSLDVLCNALTPIEIQTLIAKITARLANPIPAAHQHYNKGRKEDSDHQTESVQIPIRKNGDRRRHH